MVQFLSENLVRASATFPRDRSHAVNVPASESGRRSFQGCRLPWRLDVKGNAEASLLSADFLQGRHAGKAGIVLEVR